MKELKHALNRDIIPRNLRNTILFNTKRATNLCISTPTIIDQITDHEIKILRLYENTVQLIVNLI